MLQWKICWNTVFHFAFAHVICPQMTSGISKFQPLFHNIRAHRKILGSIFPVWGLSYRFHNSAEELMLFCKGVPPWNSQAICTWWHKSHDREQKRGLGSRAPWSVVCHSASERPDWGRQCDFSHCGQVESSTALWRLSAAAHCPSFQHWCFGKAHVVAEPELQRSRRSNKARGSVVV